MMKPTDCEAEDQETVCRTIYESECWTKQHETKVGEIDRYVDRYIVYINIYRCTDRYR